MEDWRKKADILRALSLISTTKACSGHPTSCLSSADIIMILFDKYFAYDLKDPQNPNNDKLLFSKGHAAPLLYSAFSLCGVVERKKLLTLRKFKSVLEGHPTPRFSYSDVATGSLGQGLSVGAGLAYGIRAETSNTPKVYVLLGDGEVAEGQVYEACNFASFYKLNNLIAIVDINGLGQTGKTPYYYDLSHYENMFYSAGFNTRVINGHNFYEIEGALNEAVYNTTSSPFVILAKTVKGKGVSFLESREDFHGRALSEKELEKALEELKIDKSVINKNEVLFHLKTPETTSVIAENSTMKNDEAVSDQMGLLLSTSPSTLSSGPKCRDRNGNNAVIDKNYKIGEQISTREAFGKALVEVGQKNNNVYILDADVSNSTYTQDFKNIFPERFIECFIAEQNMVSVACGISALRKIPVVSTFAAFLTRAYDQIRMSRISGANIKFVGSHAGVSIGEDGPSQMGLEDIAMFSVYPESVILHPCDAVSCKKLTHKIFESTDISYFRTLRGKTPVIYKEDEEFDIGGSKVLKNSDNDSLILITAGVTVHEALKAYNILKKESIDICIIDAYSIKPFDKKTVVECLNTCKNKILITVEDHSINGGLGDAVLSAVSDTGIKVYKLGIRMMPCSGDKDSLFDEFGISSKHIVNKVKELLKNEGFENV